MDEEGEPLDYDDSVLVHDDDDALLLDIDNLIADTDSNAVAAQPESVIDKTLNEICANASAESGIDLDVSQPGVEPDLLSGVGNEVTKPPGNNCKQTSVLSIYSVKLTTLCH